MNRGRWALEAVVVEGGDLEIAGVDVWQCEWRLLDIGTLEVPHPSYRHQKHTLWTFAIND